MRTFAVVFLLLIALSARCQPLEGGYLRRDPATGRQEGYYFQKSGEFIWFRFSNSQRELGNGSYSLKSDSLTLKFETARRQFDVQLIESMPTNSNGTTFIEVRAMHSGGSPLQGIKVFIEKSNVAKVTDRSGYATIEIQTPPVKDRIHFELDGYRSYFAEYPLKAMHIIFGLIIDDTIRYRENQVTSVKFKKKRRSIHLGPLKYRKVSQNRFYSYL